MYVAKFDRNKIFWKVTLFEKNWSEEMLSNQVSFIDEKSFVFHRSAYRWINKEVAKNLFDNHLLEIIDG